MTDKQLVARVARVEKILAADQATEQMKFRVTNITADSLSAELDVTEAHTNGVGICHGGVLFMLADSATGIAANSLQSDGLWVTRNATITFRAPAHVGETLTATAELVQVENDRRRKFVAWIRSEAGDVARLDSNLSMLAVSAVDGGAPGETVTGS